MIKVGSDFSGVGAFDFALGRITPFETVFACDWDKYARQSYIANHGEPPYYPSDVYDREIPEESLDIYMTSPPCQSFSLAGKREGKNSDKGILFFNSHEFIQKNKPRFFIFENVKGLLSDDEGNTFQEWVNMLGGKSVNGLPILFPYENSVPYHLYWQVLNSKKHGVPQNRERVFLVGIRDDEDNQFQFPKEEHLTKRLKDVLEEEVDEKYFLSDALLSYFADHKEIHKERGNGFKFEPHNKETVVSNAISTKCVTRQTDPFIKIKSATSKGYETATENDSINFSVPNSETRRGRVGKEVAQTLDTQCNQGVICGALRGRGENNKATLELNSKDHSNALITSQLANLIVSQTLDTQCNQGVIDQYKIRRLTPRECFRLQDFSDTFKFVVSDSQLYKQAGNSITVRVLEKILRNLKL